MVSGSEVLNEITKRRNKAKQENDGYSAEIKALEGKIDEVIQEREDLYLKLAQTYLPALDAESLADTLSEVRVRVQELFQESKLIERSLMKD